MALPVDIRAVLVCVDYADILKVTIPYNQHHFTETYVVTSSQDKETTDLCNQLGLELLVTDLFYEDGAIFNKWRALEWALDEMGRDGWICNMDADVLWPRQLPDFHYEFGKLYSPVRRMWGDCVDKAIPEEKDWGDYPIHKNIFEWAGYTQIFHAKDPVLGIPPWHETNWIHAGGADSFFQAKWAKENKIRTPWECLHIGQDGMNWFGRATMRLDGNMPERAELHRLQTEELMKSRRYRNPADLYGPEKLRK